VAAVIAITIVLLVGGCFAVQFIIGSDYSRAPIDVGLLDTDPEVYVEPGDEFTVLLFGHPSHPEVAWEVLSFDDSVVNLDDSQHTPRAGQPPPPEEMPPEIGAVYAAIPENEKYYHVEEGDGARIWYTPDTMFLFTGGDPGSTSISFELVIEGEVLWTFSFPVTVVEDACAYFVDPESQTKVPHRCG
jgi:hypothetical protein